jgi:hypothetical protein
VHLQHYYYVACCLSTKHVIFRHISVVTPHEWLHSFLPEFLNTVAHFEYVSFTFNAIYTNSLHCSRFSKGNSSILLFPSQLPVKIVNLHLYFVFPSVVWKFQHKRNHFFPCLSVYLKIGPSLSVKYILRAAC